jgi:hypothetical protein
VHLSSPTAVRPKAQVTSARRRRGEGRITAVAVAALTLVLWGGLPTPSWGDPAPVPQLAPAPQDVITSPVDGAFVPVNSLTVSGLGTTLGNTVTLSLNSAVVCTTTVVETSPGNLGWTCAIGFVANGPNQILTAVEQLETETQQDTHTVHVLGPPSIDGHTPTTGVVSGSGIPGGTVAVTLPGAIGACQSAVTASGYWSCTPAASPGAPAPSGLHKVSAAQSHSAIGPAGSRSVAATRTIEIDSVRPAPPAITSPRGDYRLIRLPAIFTGTGEPGASVDVYIDGVPVCFATIAADSSWSCVGGAGTTNSAHWVKAIQRDIAGNQSDPTAEMRVFFGPRAAAPAKPSPLPTSGGLPPPPPLSVPSPSALPTFPSFASDFDLADALTNWGTRTSFGTTLPGLAESVERGNWWRAPLLALGAIVLLAVPLRLLASSLRGRIRWPLGQITGRNRNDVPAADAHTVGMNPWLAGFVPFAVAVAFIAVSSGVSGEVRYLRLAFAVATAVAVLNVVGIALGARIGYRWQGVDGRLRFLPLLLIAAIGLTLLTRITGLVPPLVSGALIGVRFAHDTPVRKRALVNLVQVGMMTAMGVAGWVGHSLLPVGEGFWPALVSESLAALSLAGLGSALVLTSPLAALPGRTIMEWHRSVWFATAFVVASISFAILLGGSGSRLPVGPLAIAAAGFAAMSIGVWAWVQLVVRPTASQRDKSPVAPPAAAVRR